jgi:hypothetical protein
LTVGEDWRGREGLLELAGAVVLSYPGRHDEADTRLASAIATLRRHRLVIDEAAELYESHGAGEAWLRRGPPISG